MHPDHHSARRAGEGPPREGGGLRDEPESALPASSLALAHAVGAISSDLDTRSVLTRIVTSACELTGARYAACSVQGPDGRLSDFINHGVDQATIDLIGREPDGRGLLQVSHDDAEPLRLENLEAHPDSVGFPDHHPAMTSLLRFPIRVRGTALGHLHVSEKADGRPFTSDDELVVGALANAAGLAIDNANAYALSERRQRWLEMFGELHELLMPPITLSDALDRIAAAVRSASDAASAAVVQVPETAQPFAAATSGHVDSPTSEEGTHLDEVVRSVVASGEVVEMSIRDSVAVLAPLRAHLTMPGVLVIIHPRRARSDQLEERELLVSFADQAALALDRTQALADRERMAVVSDRDRIARDLHDVVIQRLFATGLQMQSIRSLAPTEELRAKIDQNVRDLDQTIRDIRGTIFELQTRPQNSLRTEVRDLIREYVPILGFAPSVQMHGPVDSPVDPKIQQQLVAVLREALSNVARHAEAGSASVELKVTPTHLRLRVADNGRGIPEEREESGLRNARRRAVMLGGRLDLWPNEPSGTVFLWGVPFDPQAGIGA